MLPNGDWGVRLHAAASRRARVGDNVEVAVTAKSGRVAHVKARITDIVVNEHGGRQAIGQIVERDNGRGREPHFETAHGVTAAARSAAPRRATPASRAAARSRRSSTRASSATSRSRTRRARTSTDWRRRPTSWCSTRCSRAGAGAGGLGRCFGERGPVADLAALACELVLAHGAP